MKVAAIGALAYLLIVIAGYVVREFSSDPNLVLGSLLTLAFGVVLGVLPAMVAGLVTGGLLGLVLGAVTRPGVILGALTGIVLAGVVVGGVDLVVLRITGGLGPSLSTRLVGLPSLLFVIGFGCVGAWLQRAPVLPAADVRDSPEIDPGGPISFRLAPGPHRHD